MKKMFGMIVKYSYLKCTFIIIIIALVTLGLSFIINEKWQSIFQNVFAGLITGIVITLIGSIKGKEIKELEFEKQLLDELDSIFSGHYDAYSSYFRHYFSNDEEYEKAASHLIEQLRSVDMYISEKNENNVVTKMLKNEASVYFVSEGKYDLIKIQERYDDLDGIFWGREKFDLDMRSKVNDIINEIDDFHDDVRNTVNQKLSMIKTREYELMKSII